MSRTKKRKVAERRKQAVAARHRAVAASDEKKECERTAFLAPVRVWRRAKEASESFFDFFWFLVFFGDFAAAFSWFPAWSCFVGWTWMFFFETRVELRSLVHEVHERVYER